MNFSPAGENPAASSLRTQIALSTLQQAQLIKLATTEAKSEQDRLQGILSITSDDDKSQKVKEKDLRDLLTKWGYVAPHETTAKKDAASSEVSPVVHVTFDHCGPPVIDNAAYYPPIFDQII